MEDQGKRLLLAVAIAFGIMMAWSFLFPPEEPKEDDKKKTDDAAEVADGDSKPAPTPGTADVAPSTADGSDAAPAAPVVARGEEQLVTMEFDTFTAVFSNYGGAIKSWRMKGEQFENRSTGEQIDVAYTGRQDFAPDVDYELYALLVNFVPVEGQISHTLPAKQEWKVEKKTDTSILYTLKTDKLQLWKEFTVLPEDYLVRLELKVKNLSNEAVQQALKVSTFGWQDPGEDTDGGWIRIDRAWRAACYVDGEFSTNSPGYLKEKGGKTRRGSVRWAGITHAYFLQAFALQEEGYSQSKCALSAVNGAPRGTMRADMVLGPPNKLEPGKGFARHFTAYFGPKYLDKLDAADEVAGHETAFAESVDLGWFGFIARPLLWLLLLFQGFTVNWGIAIILLTIVVKTATLYWTTKSMRSMRAMSRLKPRVEEIQKKYKGDRQKSQVEIMNLYKAHGVNPLSGCLPMLLQMPIWIALYQSLRVAAELFQAPLIPGWIDDLTATDPYYIMPVLLMAMMFVQARLTPTTADSTQQKIMQWGLPIMFGVMGFMFPAGLTLYILTNTALTALHHLWLHKTDPHQPLPATGKDSGKDGGTTSGRKGSKGKKASKAAADEDEAGSDGDADGDGPDGDDDAAAKSAKPKAKSSSQGGKKGGSKRGGSKKRGGQGKKKKKGSR